MKRCPRCSAKNANSNARCSKCGCKIPAASSTVSAVPARRKTGFAAGILAVIVLIAVIVLGASAISGHFARIKVMSSAEKTLAALSDATARSDTITAFRAVMEEISDSGNHRVEAAVGTEVYDLQYEANYSLSRERMSGNLVYTNRTKNRAIPIEIYANHKEVRLLAPSLTGEAYGFTFADLAKKKGVTVKELALYEPFSLTGALESMAGESWDAFLKSIDAEKYRDEGFLPGDPSRSCTVYKVSWDAKKAKALLSSLSPGGIFSLPIDLFGWMAGSEADCRCYVDENGYLAAVDWVAAGAKYTLCFLGTDNPWRDLALTWDPLIGNTVVYNGGIRIGEGKLEFLLEDSSSTFFGISMDEQTGDFSVTSRGAALISGSIEAQQDFAGVELILVGDQAQTFHASVGFGTRMAAPEERDFKYTDLLHMSANEIQRLIIDVTG